MNEKGGQGKIPYSPTIIRKGIFVRIPKLCFLHWLAGTNICILE